MGDHFVRKCKHGVQLGQCRCASPNKAVLLVDCPPSHAEWTEEEHPVILGKVELASSGSVAKSPEPETRVTREWLLGLIDAERDDLAAELMRELPVLGTDHLVIQAKMGALMLSENLAMRIRGER